MFVGYLYIFFGEMSIQVLCPSLISFFFCYWAVWDFYIFWILTLHQICNYFLPFSSLPFHFVDDLLCCAEAFEFDIVPLVYFLFCCLCFRCYIQKIISKTCVKELLFLCFLLGVLLFQVLNIKSLIHFELIFVNGIS